VYHFGPVSSAAPRRRRFAGRNFSLGCDLTAFAKEDRGRKTIKKPYARSTETLNGDLFKKVCAVCHGRGVKGIDRRRKLSRRPADLTWLAKRRRCFPELQVID